MGWERERIERDLIVRVCDFARWPRPFDSVAVLEHFVEHPWFDTGPGGPGILGTARGTARLQSGAWAVNSLGVIPPGAFAVAIADDPPPDPVFFDFGALPSRARRPALVAPSAFERDQEVVRHQLHLVWEDRLDAVRHELERHLTEHPDLVRAVFDWETVRPRIWLATVQGACLLGLALLIKRKNLRCALRWNDCCGPWFPPADQPGRPHGECHHRKPRRSYLQRRRS